MSEKTRLTPQLADTTYAHTLVIESSQECHSLKKQLTEIFCSEKFYVILPSVQQTAPVFGHPRKCDSNGDQLTAFMQWFAAIWSFNKITSKRSVPQCSRGRRQARSWTQDKGLNNLPAGMVFQLTAHGKLTLLKGLWSISDLIYA